MSCNGCRVLRKGCSETCMLRPCLQWIDTPEAQAHATVFVAKFFGRAGLMSFISNVPLHQRPALFQSLLYEACGRTVSPVTGAVGLLWTGNWHMCQAAVETVLRGGTLRPIPDFLVAAPPSPTTADANDMSEVVCPPKHQHLTNSSATGQNYMAAFNMLQDLNSSTTTTDNNIKTTSPPRFTNSKRRRLKNDLPHHQRKSRQPDLSLTPPAFLHAPPSQRWIPDEKQRPGTPSLNSEESATTVTFESGCGAAAGNYHHHQHHAQLISPAAVEPLLLNLFV